MDFIAWSGVQQRKISIAAAATVALCSRDITLSEESRIIASMMRAEMTVFTPICGAFSGALLFSAPSSRLSRTGRRRRIASVARIPTTRQKIPGIVGAKKPICCPVFWAYRPAMIMLGGVPMMVQIPPMPAA